MATETNKIGIGHKSIPCENCQRLQAKIEQLKIRLGESRKLGKGLTWTKYAQIEFKRAEKLQAKIEQLEKSIRELKDDSQHIKDWLKGDLSALTRFRIVKAIDQMCDDAIAKAEELLKQ